MKQKKEAMLSLSNEILEDIELSKIPLFQICLKTKRLARLSGDEMYEKAFGYEMIGYPQQSVGDLSEEIKKIALFSDRIKEESKKIFDMGIEQIQEQIDHYKNIPTKFSRYSDIFNLNHFIKKFSERRKFIHDYILSKNIEFEFEDALESLSSSLIERVSNKISQYIPDGTKKITSYMENIKSNNPEDWANATTTIRRILSNLAKKIEPNNHSDKYHTILKKYIKEQYKDVVEIHMKYIVDEANEGTHKKVSNREEAEKILLHVCLFLDEIEWSKIK